MRYVFEETEAFKILARRAAEAERRYAASQATTLATTRAATLATHVARRVDRRAPTTDVPDTPRHLFP